jgi:hypothetical protein
MRLVRSLAVWIARRGVRLIDAILLRCHPVEAFAEDRDCILCVRPAALDVPLALSDGTRLQAGDKLAEIHFWNDHLPSMSEGGADMGWAFQFRHRLTYSLRLLAARLPTESRYAGFVALKGQLGFIQGRHISPLQSLAAHLGFTLLLREAPGLRLWKGSFWACLYAWWLMWAYNPATLRGKRFRDTVISEIWMSRDRLLSRYGRGPEESQAG